MGPSEFIERPCGWDRQAPTRLRRQVFGDLSAWRSYSTSRFLDGLAPCVLHSVEFAEAVVGSGVNIELLPAMLAGRWRTLGHRFATGADMKEMGFLETMVKSLDLIAKVHPLQGTVAGVCRSLHVLLGSGRGIDTSFSAPSLPLSVFVSCPQAAERDRAERLAENLVHEALHLQLSLVERIEPLILDIPDEKPIFSPWKGEGRTARGLLHAVYVFGNLQYFWKFAASRFPASSSFAQARVETIDRQMADATHLLESGSLTAMGRRLATSFLISDRDSCTR